MAKKDTTLESWAIESRIQEYLELKAQADAFAKQADIIKEELKRIAEATPAKTVVVGAHSITITQATRESINTKEFKEAHPRLAAKFTKVTTYSTVKIR